MESIDWNFTLFGYDRSTERRKLWHYQTFSDGAVRTSSSLAQHAEQHAERQISRRRSRQRVEQRVEQENLRRSRQHVEQHAEHLISNQTG